MYTSVVSVAHALLSFLEREPGHGYDLKQAYDGLFDAGRPVQFGQIYATLGRLERDGRIRLAGQEPGQGPDRKRYEITDDGVAELERWLTEPEPPGPHLQSTLFTKTVLALASDRDADAFLDAQRAAHLARMRELTGLKADAALPTALLADYSLFHLEADLRWIDQTRGRLESLRQEVNR
jgi:DNA-binding PadR family transcriptional regulator